MIADGPGEWKQQKGYKIRMFSSGGGNLSETTPEVPMNQKRIGKRTIALSDPPSVRACAAVGGRHEGLGPLGT